MPTVIASGSLTQSHSVVPWAQCRFPPRLDIPSHHLQRPLDQVSSSLLFKESLILVLYFSSTYPLPGNTYILRCALISELSTDFLLQVALVLPSIYILVTSTTNQSTINHQPSRLSSSIRLLTALSIIVQLYCCLALRALSSGASLPASYIPTTTTRTRFLVLDSPPRSTGPQPLPTWVASFPSFPFPYSPRPHLPSTSTSTTHRLTVLRFSDRHYTSSRPPQPLFPPDGPPLSSVAAVSDAAEVVGSVLSGCESGVYLLLLIGKEYISRILPHLHSWPLRITRGGQETPPGLRCPLAATQGLMRLVVGVLLLSTRVCIRCVLLPPVELISKC